MQDYVHPDDQTQPTFETIFVVNDIWNKSYMNCGNEMKMKKWSSQWTPFMQLRKEAWKKKNSGQDDTVAMPYQLSYEATDVGNRSIVELAF